MDSKHNEANQQSVTDAAAQAPAEQRQRAPYQAPRLERLDISATQFGSFGGSDASLSS